MLHGDAAQEEADQPQAFPRERLEAPQGRSRKEATEHQGQRVFYRFYGFF